MSTAKRQCKISDSPKPIKTAYRKAVAAGRRLCARLVKLFRRVRGTRNEPLPAPHTWPPYGGTCWQPAYQEAVAMRLVADTWLAYERAKTSGYMPASVLATYLAAYNAAKVQYLAAWGAMEDCLNMVV